MSRRKVYLIDRKRVDEYRNKLGITQTQLGEYCGLTYQAMQKPKWSAYTIFKACEMLNCEPYNILPEEINVEIIPCVFINGDMVKILK